VRPRRELELPRRADRYAVVMAGGSGTRFWPRSRRRLPKQLLCITGTRTLLQQTVDRLRGLIPPTQVLVVTHRDHAAEVRRQLPQLPAANVLVEPIGRNTAPCLALAALTIGERVPDATFVSLPADHAIADPRRFRATVAAAFGWAAHERCPVTIGIVPTVAETGYGYIRLGRPLARGARRVSAFVEKPSLARARRFVRSRRYLWNSGMFVWRVDTLIALLDEHLPDLLATLRPAMRHRGRARAAALARAYRRVRPVSIDYGVMEKATRVIVVAGRFGWSDVGSWAALADVGTGRRRPTTAPVVGVDAARYVVFNPDRLVALVGIDDVIVVEAPDALLICRRDRAQDVRRVVEELERRHLNAYL
jgi:mannose-1-phosphate guanylyltransferase